MKHLELRVRALSLDPHKPAINGRSYHAESVYASFDEHLTPEQGLIPVFYRLDVNAAKCAAVASSLTDGIVGYVREYSQETDGIHIFVEMKDTQLAKDFVEMTELYGNTVTMYSEATFHNMANGNCEVEPSRIVAFTMIADNGIDQVYEGDSEELMHDAGATLQQYGWQPLRFAEESEEVEEREFVSNYLLDGIEVEHKVRHVYTGVFDDNSQTCALNKVRTEIVKRVPVKVEQVEYQIQVD